MWFVVFIVALCLLLPVLLGIFRFLKTSLHGFAEVARMDAAPDPYMQDHKRHPFIKLPLPFLPSQIFIISPTLIRKYYHSSELDSLETKRELAINIFGMPMDALPLSSSRSNTITSIEKMYHHEMAPSRLPELCERFDKSWKNQMVKLEGSDFVELNAQLYEMMVLAAIEAFYGPNFPAIACLKPLRQIMSNLAAAVILGSLKWPWNLLAAKFLGTKAKAGADELAGVCTSWLEKEGTSNSCELVTRTQAFARQSGWSDRETACMMGMLLFTLVANSSDAIGWVLTSISQAPLARAEIITEVALLRKKDVHLSASVLMKTAPALYSVLCETFRVFTSPLSVRVAKKSLTLTSGKDFLIIPADWRVIAPSRALNVDKALWGDAASHFDCRRFYGERGQKLVKDMAPFGGGSSICSGRHFAVSELAAAVVSVLGSLDLDFSSIRIVDTRGTPVLKPPTYTLIDMDGTASSAVWAGAVADPNAVQSGVFRAKYKTYIALSPATRQTI